MAGSRSRHSPIGSNEPLAAFSTVARNARTHSLSLMKIFCLMSVCATFACHARGGDIRGTVRAEGKQGVEAQASDGKYESRKFKFVERVDYSAFKEFVVYIDQPPSEKATPPAKPVTVVTQRDATFKPHVLPVVVGTTVAWPNQDEILHNVFSYSDPKQFDLGLYKDEVKNVKFDTAGRVDVFCSIHSKMHCIILVLENPFFATTDATGSYVIKDVPPGKYRLKAWHERLPAQVLEVVVPDSGDAKANFVLGIKGLPQY